MGITLKPVTLVVAVLAVAGAASGVTVLAMRSTTVCEAAVASSPAAAVTDPSAAERAEAMRRARASNGPAAKRGQGF